MQLYLYKLIKSDTNVPAYPFIVYLPAKPPSPPPFSPVESPPPSPKEYDPVLDTPEEIEKWINARKKIFHTKIELRNFWRMNRKKLKRRYEQIRD